MYPKFVFQTFQTFASSICTAFPDSEARQVGKWLNELLTARFRWMLRCEKTMLPNRQTDELNYRAINSRLAVCIVLWLSPSFVVWRSPLGSPCGFCRLVLSPFGFRRFALAAWLAVWLIVWLAIWWLQPLHRDAINCAIQWLIITSASLLHKILHEQCLLSSSTRFSISNCLTSLEELRNELLNARLDWLAACTESAHKTTADWRLIGDHQVWQWWKSVMDYESSLH